MLAIAPARSIVIDDLEITLDNPYWMRGSFVRGDAFSHADPTAIGLRIASPAKAESIRGLVDAALTASPAIHGIRTQLENTFAIYVNGRRRDVTTNERLNGADAADPFRTYVTPPTPLAGSDAFDDIIVKTGETREGEVTRYPYSSNSRLVRQVVGDAQLIDPAGVVVSESALDMPGVSFFRFKTDERPEIEQSPSGLNFFSAAIGFCYMTQIARFIYHQKLNIRGARIVQCTPLRAYRQHRRWRLDQDTGAGRHSPVPVGRRERRDT